VRLLRRRGKFTERDFALLARAFNRGRALHPFYLTAWVLLPDPAATGHCILNGYAGGSADEQKKRCGLIVDRVRTPSDPRARI
jgi:hypothetical protein